MSNETRVGAWAGKATITEPIWNVAAAANMAITDLHLMVNDHAAERHPMGFMDRPGRGKRTAPVSDLIPVAKQCAHHGLRLHLTSWVMPHEDYALGLIAYMAEACGRLSSICPVQSVMLDVEEPWARAKSPQHEESAEQLAAGLSQAGGRWGVTAIGYANSNTRPLLRRAHYGVPQCYVTNGSGLRAGGIANVLTRWRAQLGPSAELWCGLAGYRTTPALMRESIAASQGLETCWWSLHQLRASAERAAVLSELHRPLECPPVA